MAIETFTLDKVKKYLNANPFNLMVIPVLAKRVKLMNGSLVEPYGIDLLLETTVKKCNFSSKNMIDNNDFIEQQ